MSSRHRRPSTGGHNDLRTLGALHVTLTGGEPLAHPQFFEIACAAAERHFAITIFTNGSRIDSSTAAQLATLNPFVVELTLHGATAAVHDTTTARSGSYAAVISAIAHLCDAGVRVRVKTVLTSINELELEPMIALASALRVSFSVDPNVTPRDDGSTDPLRFRASPEARLRAFTWARSLGELPQAQRTFGEANCALGEKTLAIDPEGNVYPCMQWRASALGNVRHTPLVELWRTSRVRREASEIAREVVRRLEKQGHVSAFPYCPALALERTGSPYTPSPGFVEDATIAGLLR
ncbi:MAG: radical SAM protein [Thermoanaerobaculia bacterium]